MLKPVELIVTNRLHGIAEALEALKDDARKAIDMTHLSTELARHLLCDIAHSAPLPAVVAALEAAGVPGGVDAITQRLAAVLQRRAEDGCATPPNAAPEGRLSGYVVPFPKG